MTLWFVFALMTAAAIFAVLWPLARRHDRFRSGSDLAVYRDQLEEIERDRAGGRIGEAEAEAARTEVARRLLAAADAESLAGNIAPAESMTWRRRAVALTALIVLPLGAAAVYLALGAPSLPDQPLAARTAPEQSIEKLVAQIETHLAAHPQDGRGWEVVAPVYLRLGRAADAVKARRNALSINGETADRQADLGEALVAAANGVVSAEAKGAFERAAVLDPGQIKARYFLGMAAEQDGRRDEAAEIWRALLAGAPADAEWAGFVRQELARLDGPSEDEIAAASNLSAEQRNAMVRGMVDRLAERLNRDGSDVDGWLRLMRSYMVLGERQKAVAAAGEARRALAGEPDKLRRIDELVKGLGLQG
jgi:cytochrome c-type biogenesis protein CcmH